MEAEKFTHIADLLHGAWNVMDRCCLELNMVYTSERFDRSNSLFPFIDFHDAFKGQIERLYDAKGAIREIEKWYRDFGEKLNRDKNS